jgi:hypothetical protein
VENFGIFAEGIGYFHVPRGNELFVIFLFYIIFGKVVPIGRIIFY